jgi:hypothetical protein
MRKCSHHGQSTTKLYGSGGRGEGVKSDDDDPVGHDGMVLCVVVSNVLVYRFVSW